MTHAKGFSLIEVVIAIGVVAGGVAVVLGLLPMLTRNSQDANDAQTALRLSDSVTIELREQTSSDFNSYAVSIPAAGIDLVAEKNGTNVRSLSMTDNPIRDRYFLINVRKFTTGSLAYTSGDGVLPLQVTISWPYRVLAAGTLLPESAVDERQTVTFNLALNP